MSVESDVSLVFSTDQPNSSEVVLAERFRILTDSPISELDLPGAAAFVARDQNNPTRPMFARICGTGVLPRVETMVQLKNLNEVKLMRPLDWGPVYLPAEKQRRFVVIFDRPGKPALMKSMADQIQPMATDTIIKTVLGPIAETLMQMTRRGQLHRAIRPDNMYASDEEGAPVILGECVSTPPGLTQSVIFEPVEMGLTPSWGRGAGTIGDDMYALGATIMFLALGKCPVAGMKDHEIISAKAQQGSFTALLCGERPPLGLRETLRGLLCDDPAERWVAEDVEQFIAGTQRRAVALSKEIRADRAFQFDERGFRQRRSLAQAFGENWKLAKAAILSEEFEQWLGRIDTDATADESDSERFREIVPPVEAELDARYVAQIIMLLDPTGPLRYKGITVNADGIGLTLAKAVLTGDIKTVGILADCITQGAPVDWLENREVVFNAEQGVMIRTFKRVQQLLKHDGPGYGIERCVYELNPFAPCMGDMLAKGYVYSLRDLLPALDAIVRERGALPDFIDRHVVAFVAARSKGQIDRKLSILEGDDENSLRAGLGMTALLGIVQDEYGPATVPHLTRWLADELKSGIDQFHSSSLREELKLKLEQIVGIGRLSQLHAHLSDPQAIKRDQAKYAAARRDYTAATSQIARLESERFHEIARMSGWQMASGISTFIAFSTVVALLIW